LIVPENVLFLGHLLYSVTRTREQGSGFSGCTLDVPLVLVVLEPIWGMICL